MSKTLIAQVAVAVIVDGARQTIEPGAPLPELSEHDAQALLDCGAAIDPEALDAEAKQEAKQATKDMAEFKAARKAVQAEQASIKAAA